MCSPHSGSQANAAAYMALLSPGDTLLGMALSDGGHLSHGAAPNFSGKLYRAVQYGLDADGVEIDYDQVRDLALKHRPQLIVAGFSAYSRVVDWGRFREIADEAGAKLLVDMAHVAGLVAAGLYPNPVPVADVVTTTTHKTLRGPRGGLILARGGDEALERSLNSGGVPRQPRRPADACHRGQGSVPVGGGQRRFPSPAGAGGRQCPRHGAARAAAGLRSGRRRHRQPSGSC